MLFFFLRILSKKRRGAGITCPGTLAAIDICSPACSPNAQSSTRHHRRRTLFITASTPDKGVNYTHVGPSSSAAPQEQSPSSIFRDGTAPVFRACASAMQQPTLQNVRIRSTRDAHHIFYAVALKRLPMIVTRLDAEECRAIVSGNVYVWEERGGNSEATGFGIERWCVSVLC